MEIIGEMLEFVPWNPRVLGAGASPDRNGVDDHAIVGGKVGVGVDIDEKRLLTSAFAELRIVSEETGWFNTRALLSCRTARDCDQKHA